MALFFWSNTMTIDKPIPKTPKEKNPVQLIEDGDPNGGAEEDEDIWGG